MRAFVIRGPRDAAVVEVDSPVPGQGQVVVDVARVGLCGTDVELFTGSMAYLLAGTQVVPFVPGHEWAGTVSAVGAGVDTGWVGQRVTGDTMLGCGRCQMCRSGRHHVCPDRHEIGIRGNWPGALAERLLVPESALRRLPDALDDAAGALVEPAGCALRAVEAAQLTPGQRLCVFGPGTLGLLSVQFALARGATVDVIGIDPAGLALARQVGAAAVWSADELPDRRYDAVINASTAPEVPQLALRRVLPTGRVVLVGLADRPSLVDTREAVLADVTIVGVLAASAGLAGAIEAMAAGQVAVDRLVGATVGLAEVADVLAGHRPQGADNGPKIQVDPRR
ncbi:alcohol dehydrogenase catalytic domain-containing protein [Solwaraspora sp. WMMD1047]|uniref:zinc-dependent alcohol dehydrogenase n=1 Tax=Solwaraspora sp. WMMD1047 TaxID=3016102 RepID=UPI002417DB50|nr:alcohol dehydrogenase catalytic domain-containing protein [Solwaraspora sp. WMMD1047]MDG4829498.1 alcohol dehydrogenase catalytic domain-containing protein [Solwaraspora sp. WMMD1047]